MPTAQEDEPEIPKTKLFVGNLVSTVTSEDLNLLFGITTPFLQNNCSINIVQAANAGELNSATIEVPEQIHSELLKLNGIEFHGRQLSIQKESWDENDTVEDFERDFRYVLPKVF